MPKWLPRHAQSHNSSTGHTSHKDRKIQLTRLSVRAPLCRIPQKNAKSPQKRAVKRHDFCGSSFFPGSIAKGSSSKSGCQLHLPTSHANLSRVTSPANFSCQLVESYFTCQLLMPTCRELLHLPTSHANLSRVTPPANFSCQLVESYFTCLLLMSTFRLLFHSTKSTS